MERSLLDRVMEPAVPLPQPGRWAAARGEEEEEEEEEEEGVPGRRRASGAVAVEALLSDRLALRQVRIAHAHQLEQLEADRASLWSELQNARRRQRLPWQQNGAAARRGSESWRQLQRATQALVDAAAAGDAASGEVAALREELQRENSRLHDLRDAQHAASKLRADTDRRHGELSQAYAAAQQQTAATAALAQEVAPVLRSCLKLAQRQCWLLEHRHNQGDAGSGGEEAAGADADEPTTPVPTVTVTAVAVRRARLYTAEHDEDTATRHKARSVTPLEAGEVVRCSCWPDRGGEWLKLTGRGASARSALADGSALALCGQAVGQGQIDHEHGIGCWVRRSAMQIVSEHKPEATAGEEARSAPLEAPDPNADGLPHPSPPTEKSEGGLPPALTGRLDHALGFGVVGQVKHSNRRGSNGGEESLLHGHSASSSAVLESLGPRDWQDVSESVAAAASGTHAMEQAADRRVQDGTVPEFEGVLPGLSAARQWENRYWQKVDELLEEQLQAKRERSDKEALMFERTHTRKALWAASRRSKQKTADLRGELAVVRSTTVEMTRQWHDCQELTTRLAEALADSLAKEKVREAEDAKERERRATPAPAATLVSRRLLLLCVPGRQPRHLLNFAIITHSIRDVLACCVFIPGCTSRRAKGAAGSVQGCGRGAERG